jgi:hypothetical protein
VASWFAAAPSAWFGTLADELAESRALATAAAQPETCSIVGQLTTRTSRGDTISRDVVRATGVPIRVSRNPIPVFMAESGGVFGRSGQLIDTTAQAFNGYLPWGTPVGESDHLLLASGTRYEVTSVDDEGSLGVEVLVGLVRLGVDQPGSGEEG